MDTDIEQRLTAVFRKVFDDQGLNISDSTTADDVTMWDSLNHMELIAEVENEFKVVFSLDDVMAFSCVGDMIRCIRLKLI